MNATDQPPEHTIAVTGSGKVTVVPDLATINLGVLIERNTAKAARQAAAESMTQVVAAIKALGIDDKDIATSTISLQPVYNYNNNGGNPKIRGYQLQNAVTVTVRDLDKLGDVLDNSVVSGATQVNGITFDVADRTAAEAKAREAAVADAKAKADTLAKGVGVSITGVSSISETVIDPGLVRPRDGRRRGRRGRRLDPGHGRHDGRDDRRPGHLPHQLRGLARVPSTRHATADPRSAVAASRDIAGPGNPPRRR